MPGRPEYYLAVTAMASYSPDGARAPVCSRRLVRRSAVLISWRCMCFRLGSR